MMSAMDASTPIRWSDPEAVAACVQAHRPRLLAFVEHRMGPGLRQRLDPDDIVQEVSLAAVRPANAPPDEAAPQRDPFNWLCHVAEQRIIDAPAATSVPPSGMPPARCRSTLRDAVAPTTTPVVWPRCSPQA